MNIKMINEIIENLKENAGDGLLSSTVISVSQGQSLINYNSDTRQDALIAKLTSFTVDAVAESKFGHLGDYYAIKLSYNGQPVYATVLVKDDYAWASVFDLNEVQIGMIMNMILPECIESFSKVFK